MCEDILILSFTPEGEHAYGASDTSGPPDPVFEVIDCGGGEAEIVLSAQWGDDGCYECGPPHKNIAVRFRASQEIIDAARILADAVESRLRQLDDAHDRHWQPVRDRENADSIRVRCGDNETSGDWHGGLTVWEIHNRYAGSVKIKYRASWVVTDFQGNAVSSGDENFLVTDGMTVTFTNPPAE